MRAARARSSASAEGGPVLRRAARCAHRARSHRGWAGRHAAPPASGVSHSLDDAGDEVGERRRERLVHGGEARLALRLGVLQRQKHRCEDQHRILDGPRPRLHAQGEIFRRLHRERTQARVDALDIGAQQCAAPPAAQARSRAARALADAARGVRVSIFRAADPNNLGQLSRGPSPREVHLEEAILRVHESPVHAPRRRARLR